MGHIAIGHIADFKGGWAIIPFFETPHNWSRTEANRDGLGRWVSACGLPASTSKAVRPIVGGNFSKCKKCKKRDK